MKILILPVLFAVLWALLLSSKEPSAFGDVTGRCEGDCVSGSGCRYCESTQSENCPLTDEDEDR